MAETMTLATGQVELIKDLEVLTKDLFAVYFEQYVATQSSFRNHHDFMVALSGALDVSTAGRLDRLMEEAADFIRTSRTLLAVRQGEPDPYPCAK